MAASPAASSRRSAGSSSASLKRSQDDQRSSGSLLTVPLDTLVNHLLAAKRSLSSMTLVLRANDIATTARNAHEDTSIIAAQAGFLRSSILDQAAILVRVRRNLQASYDWGKRDFKKLVRAMDEVDGALEGTMNMLRGTTVQSVLRPKGEDPKNLLDFVDEDSVHGLREAMKKSIQELQGIQQSFDGDLLRFDNDIRDLRKILTESPLPSSSQSDMENDLSMTERLESLVDHSSNMAHLLASLTTHFDMCVTAIRTTEGGAALARRKAAEVTQSQGPDGVSISGVIAEQEQNVSDLEPKTASDRAEMLKVVVQDAAEVDDVVQEIQDRLAAMEEEHVILEDQTAQTRKAYNAVLEAFAILGDIGDRLAVYVAAEEDFRVRWDMEKEAVFVKINEMKELQEFYERYSGAYDSLILEVERRRAVDDRIRSIWRKAQESVDKLLESDQIAREAFRGDVGEFLPTDLWADMHGSAHRWEVVPIKDETNTQGQESQEVQKLRRSMGSSAARSRLTQRDQLGGEQTPRGSGK